MRSRSAGESTSGGTSIDGRFAKTYSTVSRAWSRCAMAAAWSSACCEVSEKSTGQRTCVKRDMAESLNCHQAWPVPRLGAPYFARRSRPAVTATELLPAAADYFARPGRGNTALAVTRAIVAGIELALRCHEGRTHGSNLDPRTVASVPGVDSREVAPSPECGPALGAPGTLCPDRSRFPDPSRTGPDLPGMHALRRADPRLGNCAADRPTNNTCSGAASRGSRTCRLKQSSAGGSASWGLPTSLRSVARTRRLASCTSSSLARGCVC